MKEPIPISMKALISAILKKDEELQELAENLRLWVARVCSPNPGTSEQKIRSGSSSSIEGISGWEPIGKTRIIGIWR